MNYRRLFIQDSLVFITIVTNDGVPLLVKNIDLLKRAYINVRKYYNFKLIAYSIQPDHIHFIIKPNCIGDYPKIVKSFKYSITKLFNVGLVNPTYKKLWQNRYFEHTIINEEDLNRHLDYIHYNPVKHGFSKNPKEWKYSSFQKFVKNNLYNVNWGNDIDIKNILDMNLE